MARATMSASRGRSWTRLPDDLVIDVEVHVHEVILYPHDRRPRNFRQSFSRRNRELPSRFTNDLKALHDGIEQYPVAADRTSIVLPSRRMLHQVRRVHDVP